MNDFVNALKEDLSDRRMLPFVAVAVAALVGAFAYVMLAGGSSESTPSAASHRIAARAAGGLAISQVAPAAAAGETTSGVAVAHAGSAHDPFTLLPGAAATFAAGHGPSSSPDEESEQADAKRNVTEALKAAGITGNANSGSGSSGSSEQPAGQESPPSNSGSKGSGKSAPKTQTTPKTVYQVSVLFGEPSPGTPSEGSGLKPYENLKLLTPLPSKQEPLIVFRGVSDHGKRATFTIAGETILHGSGKCLPSAYQCQAIQLRAGQSEQLQYLPPGSQAVQSYELRLVSITPAAASAAAVASLWRGQSRAGMTVLRRANLVAIPGLSLTSLAGVLVPSS